jgi:hypothetical protein
MWQFSISRHASVGIRVEVRARALVCCVFMRDVRIIFHAGNIYLRSLGRYVGCMAGIAAHSVDRVARRSEEQHYTPAR